MHSQDNTYNYNLKSNGIVNKRKDRLQNEKYIYI